MTDILDYKEEGTFIIEHEGVRYQLPRHCPHRSGRLDHGKINLHAKTVSCPLHQSVFRFDSGEQVAGPSCGKLKVAITKSTKCD